MLGVYRRQRQRGLVQRENTGERVGDEGNVRGRTRVGKGERKEEKVNGKRQEESGRH